MIKNSNGELQSVSKENHPIDCPIEINVYPFCSSNTSQPPMIDYVNELPNLRDLLKQRDQLLNSIESKRPKIDSTILNEQPNIIATHADYRLFAVINHHGGSSDVGKQKEKQTFLPRKMFIFFKGHYTATVYDAKADTWWTYDDTSVASCTEQRVLKNLAPDAYGVMYMHKYGMNYLLFTLILFIYRDILNLFEPTSNN